MRPSPAGRSPRRHLGSARRLQTGGWRQSWARGGPRRGLSPAGGRRRRVRTAVEAAAGGATSVLPSQPESTRLQLLLGGSTGNGRVAANQCPAADVNAPRSGQSRRLGNLKGAAAPGPPPPLVEGPSPLLRLEWSPFYPSFRPALSLVRSSPRACLWSSPHSL